MGWPRMVTEVIGPVGGWLGLDGGGCDGGVGYRNALCVSSSVAILGYLGAASLIDSRR